MIEVRSEVNGSFVQTPLDRVPFTPARLCVSYSTRNTVKGIHYNLDDTARYVTCVSGAIMDVAVDMGTGRWEQTVLDDVEHKGVCIPAGFGHGFCVLSDSAVVVYLISRGYDPSREREFHPLSLGIDWLTGSPVLSERDARAPRWPG